MFGKRFLRHLGEGIRLSDLWCTCDYLFRATGQDIGIRNNRMKKQGEANKDATCQVLRVSIPQKQPKNPL
jgi:hypothetical protein